MPIVRPIARAFPRAEMLHGLLLRLKEEQAETGQT
jgi:hypothetical protein